MFKVENIIDKLKDIPHVTEEDVFNEVIKTNDSAGEQLSPYVLADMWNASMAVKFSFASGRTAHDFMTKKTSPK